MILNLRDIIMFKTAQMNRRNNMRIADGLEMLDLPVVMESGPSTIYPAVIWDDDDVILVDAGLPGQFTHFHNAIVQAGIPFERLNKIIITHHDMDHIGSLNSILNKSSKKVEVLSSGTEKLYIQAELPPIRLIQLEATLNVLSGERLQQLETLYENLKSNYINFKTNVSTILSDGEELPYCGGIQVIYTPGHSPGHISLYHKQSKTLIAGDMLQVVNQVLLPAPLFTIIDKDLAEQSLRKLTQYDIKTIICYHGGLFSHNGINQRIAELTYF